jgi:hypothetical protein
VSEVVKLDLSHGSVYTVLVDGRPHVVFRPAVKELGLSYARQLEKLRTRSWASVREKSTQIPGDDQTRRVLAVTLKTFFMWLATINENKIAEEKRPVLIAYQSESADALEAYWTKGYAVNPRLSYREQAEVLSALRGVVDSGYLETRGRQLAARALGDTPEYDPLTKPLTVSQYLEQQGLTRGAMRRIAGPFGKAVKRSYIEIHGEEPPEMEDLVGRHMVPVAQYQERHRPLFDAAWSRLNLGGAA